MSFLLHRDNTFQNGFIIPIALLLLGIQLLTGSDAPQLGIHHVHQLVFKFAEMIRVADLAQDTV